MATVLCLSIGLLAVAAPAWAAVGRMFIPPSEDARVVLTGGVNIPQGQGSGTVVVFNGPVGIQGDVQGSVIVFNGDTNVSGVVRDNLVVFNGKVSIANTARVGGNVATREPPAIAGGASIGGTVKRIRVNLNSGAFGFLVRLGVWLAYSLSTLALGFVLLLLAPRALDAARAVGLTGTGAAVGWGLAFFIGLPIVAFLAIATVVGIPLGLAILLALWLLYTFGYTASVYLLGRSLIGPPKGRGLAFLVGWLILRAVAIVPFLGGWLWLAAAAFGLGMLVMAMWRARTAGAAAPAASYASPGAAIPAPPAAG